MMNHFISMYIDNELSLDEKILFIEHASGNRAYTDETVSLLKQEKALCSILNLEVPGDVLPSRARHSSFRWVSLGVAACLLLMFSFVSWNHFTQFQDASEQLALTHASTVPHRFVVHRQGIEQIEITGSFTNWQKVSLLPTGTEGYWEVTLRVPSGEHRYSFIVDGSKHFPDPTVATQESDDFGTVNSILIVET